MSFLFGNIIIISTIGKDLKILKKKISIYKVKYLCDCLCLFLCESEDKCE